MRPELKVIERDDNGFATEKCKAEMYEALPIIVTKEDCGDFYSIEFIDKLDWADWEGDIERDTEYNHYFKCPQL